MLIREMKLGDSASVTKTVTETDVYLFAGITGDLNPAHTNEVSASQTQFGGRIAHGILGAGFISMMLGRRSCRGPAPSIWARAEIHQAGLYQGTPSRRPVPVQELFRRKEYRQAGHRMPTSTETW